MQLRSSSSKPDVLKGQTLISVAVRNILYALLMALFIVPAGQAANVNVLIIGSTQDMAGVTKYDGWADGSGTGEYLQIEGNSQPFSPTEIRSQLESILEGAGLGTINVTLRERAYGSTRLNLAAWYHFPDPRNGSQPATTERWAELRGENGTAWDYVVLIGDPYTMEYLPGMYAQGVANIADEVAKGSAETVLLAPWPGVGSDSSIAHYNEVTYRTGRTAGCKVVPAGLAWQAAGQPRGTNKTNTDAAYVAAASIYKRLWADAATSGYVRKASLAAAVDTTLDANVGQPQYSGTFNLPSPYNIGGYDRRVWVSGGTSKSSDDMVRKDLDILLRENGINSKAASSSVTDPTPWAGYLTYTGGYLSSKYANCFKFAFTYNRGNGYNNYPYGADPFGFNGQIASWGMPVADKARRDRLSNSRARHLPSRLIWAQFAQLYPAEHPVGGHYDGMRSSAAFMYTIISGKCPLEPKPNPVTQEWQLTRLGYETAWRMGYCQGRAPGFRTQRSYHRMSSTNVSQFSQTVDSDGPETMDVQFVLPLQDTVTVTASTDQPWATVSPQTLTFTPANGHITQHVTVSVADGIAPGTTFNVLYSTSSPDEVCDGLSDSWEYEVNHRPTVWGQTASAYTAETKVIYLGGADADGEGLSYEITQQPSNGTLVFDNYRVFYTSNAGYVGTDSFKFISNDGRVDSDQTATVTINVQPISMYNYNLLENPSAEYAPLNDYGWSGSFVASGSRFSVLNHATNAHSWQDVDVRDYRDAIDNGIQSFKYITTLKSSDDRPSFQIEFRNASLQVISSYSSGSIQTAGGNWETREYVGLAPAGTAYIRVNIRSTKAGTSRHYAQFDNMSFVALPLPNQPPVADDLATAVVVDTPKAIALSGTDVDEDELTFAIVDQPAHGTLTDTTTGSPIYTPDTGYLGTDSFTFRASDAYADSANVGTVSITVNPNQAPVITLDRPTVNTIYLPLNTRLMMETTVTDDGGPANPGAVSVTWEQVSGTGTAVFSHPNAEDTAVDVYAGNYVLRLTATDGEYSVTEDFTITVGDYTPPGNLAPQMYTHGPYNGVVGQPVAILGTNTDDFLPSPPGVTTQEWQLLSGPGTAVIADPAAENTTVVFDAVGTYILRLFGDDGQVKTFNDAIVEITNLPPVVDAGSDQQLDVAPASPWTPTEISTAAWYDAADASKIIASGGTVSQWLDKSGNDRHATQTTSAKRPSNGGSIGSLNALSFDSNVLDVPLGQLTTVSMYLLIDATAKPTSNNNCPIGATQAYNTGGAYLTMQSYSTAASGHAVFYGSQLPGEDRFLNGTAGAADHSFSPTILSHSGTGLSTSGLSYKIGTSRSDEGEPFKGTIGEIIICPTQHDAITRQMVEGYLAHKWNLTAKLPAGHPYETDAPDVSGTTVSLAGTASDANGPTLTTSWSVVGGTPENVSFDDATALDTTARITAEGTYVLRLTADDGIDQRYDDVTITIGEGSGNTAPIADDATVTTDEDVPVAVTLTASDADGNELTYSIVTQPANGTLSGTAPNLSYTPNAGFFGSDSFTFVANDGTEDSNIATVTIIVAEQHVLTYLADTGGTIDGISSQSVADGTDGQPVTAVADSGYQFLRWSDAAVINLTQQDGLVASQSSTGWGGVPERAIDGNTSGVWNNGSITHTNNDANAWWQVQFPASSAITEVVLYNRTDSCCTDRLNNFRLSVFDGNTETYGVDVAGLSGPSISLAIPAGTIGDRIRVSLSGTLSLAEVVVSGFETEATRIDHNVTADLTVTALFGATGTVNTPPVADGIAVTTDQDVAAPVALTAIDADGHDLTYSVTAQPANGILTGTAPNLTYSPSAGFFGSDSFTFVANDGTDDSNVATVSITVNEVVPPNEAPLVDAGSDQQVGFTPSSPWTPAEIATATWYDADDASTIIASGGTVSQWQDKSGNDNHASQSASTNQPSTGAVINGKNAIAFNPDGNGHYLTTGLEQLTTVSMYVVVDATQRGASGGYTNGVIGANIDHTTNGLEWSLEGYGTGAAATGTGYNASSKYGNGVLNGNHNFQPALLSHQGTELTSVGYDYHIGNGRQGTLWSGSRYKGLIGEIIICPTQHNDDTRQKLEGYLAHKWGLAANLPADHPYKNAAPVASGGSGTTVSLAGTASDVDGPTLTTAWSVVSGGTDNVSFADVSAVDTTASIAAEGTYVLRLTADDGIDQRYDDVTITVNEGLTAGPILAVDFSQTGDVPLQTDFKGISGNSTATVSKTFASPAASDGNLDVTISGMTHWRTRNPVSGTYASQSDLLRDSVLRNTAGTMTLELGGLKPGNYEITTYHHATQYGGGAMVQTLSDALVTDQQIFSGTTSQGTSPSAITANTFTFACDGSNVIIKMRHVAGDNMPFNGFELALLGTSPAESAQEPALAAAPAKAAATPIAEVATLERSATALELYELTVATGDKKSQLNFGVVLDGEAVDGAYADAGAFGGTAYLVDENGTGRLLEVRQFGEAVRWQLVVEAIGEPVIVSWTGFEAPEGMALYLQEVSGNRPVGAAIDMTQTNEVTCLETTEYQIVLGLERKHVLQLNAGWNLISQPLLSLAPPMFDDAYQLKGRRWRKFTDVASITAGSGYLVYADEASKFAIAGIPAASGMDLDRGWNLVGAVEASRLPEGAGKAYRLDARGNDVEVTTDDVLAPGDALMIQVKESGWFEFVPASK